MTVEEWDYRQLCSDGGCTGVIGPNGQCKTCGRAAPNWGDERKRGMRSTTDAPPLAAALAAPALNADDDIVPSAPAALGEGIAAGGWSSRQLCSDGGCIGLLGADGTCKVCGKLASGPLPVRAAADEAEYEDDGDFEDDDEDDDEEYEDDDDDDEPDEGDDVGVIQAQTPPPPAPAPVRVAAAATVVSDEPPALCADPACTGVYVGATCSTCGKERAPA